MNKDYLAGWAAARLYYQTTGSVPPHPPGPAKEQKAKAPPVRKSPPKIGGK